VRTSKWAGALALSVLAIGGITTASAVVIQRDGVRVTVLSQVMPFKLPRDHLAPIAIFVSGHVDTATGALPPQLQRMTVRVNRRGVLQSKGLPTCTLPEVKTTSTEEALGACKDALVGSGRFWADIVLPDQRPYPTRGRLLVFNGKRKGKPVVFSHIFTASPFPSSFVITFAIRKVKSGRYGTELSASLPQALGTWGFVDRIKLTLKRKYRAQRKQLSYFNASCPAPKGTNTTPVPLAEASFYFAKRKPISLRVNKSCRVTG